MSNDARWLDAVLGTLHCPTCGARYERRDLSVSGPRDEQWHVDCVCHACARRSLCVVVVHEMEIVTVPGPWRPPISIDDVLEAHRLLGTHRGNVQELFAQGR